MSDDWSMPESVGLSPMARAQRLQSCRTWKAYVSRGKWLDKPKPGLAKTGVRCQPSLAVHDQGLPMFLLFNVDSHSTPNVPSLSILY